MWLFVDFQRCVIDSLGDCFKAVRIVVWHCINFVDGGITFKPNLLLVR